VVAYRARKSRDMAPQRAIGGRCCAPCNHGKGPARTNSFKFSTNRFQSFVDGLEVHTHETSTASSPLVCNPSPVGSSWSRDVGDILAWVAADEVPDHLLSSGVETPRLFRMREISRPDLSASSSKNGASGIARADYARWDRC
jgi:hypothetical protein